MLMSVESGILRKDSLDKVVDKLASTSKQLKRLLIIKISFIFIKTCTWELGN